VGRIEEKNRGVGRERESRGKRRRIGEEDI
jgi:hypothetical protein